MTGTLPAALRTALDGAAAALPPHHLAAALADLTARYRAERRPAGPAIGGEAARLAYLIARLPATFAAARTALAELARRAPALAPASLLDLGAGAGGAAWAACETFAGFGRAVLNERDAGMIALGRRLAAAAGHPVLGAAAWRSADLTAGAGFPEADLVILSYALGELPEDAAEPVLLRAWAAARQALVLVEPGSRRGFATIRAARTRLLAAGASLAAPCPHQQACPIVDPDWCHVSVRFDRSALHRAIADGTLPYDDEKLSYVAAVRDPALALPAAGRVVRAPLRRSGHVVLDVCAGGALVRHTLSKRQGTAYRAARKTGWGDPWPAEEKSASGGPATKEGGPGGPWPPIP